MACSTPWPRRILIGSDMQTSNFSLQPQYDYSNRANGQPPRLTGYQASNQLTVKRARP